MQKSHHFSIGLAACLLILVQLACYSGPSNAAECEKEGGIWVEDPGLGNKASGYCEHPATPTGADDLPSTPSCILPASSFTWSYEELTDNSGSGGKACFAWFVFNNTSDQPIRLEAFTDLDNNAMRISKWNTVQLQPGEAWKERVSRTEYTDGVVIYVKVVRLLVIDDSNECAHLFGQENQSFWESNSQPIDELVCP